MSLRARLAARRRDSALLATARALERHGLVVGTVGNVSVREGDRVRITPTQLAYDGMRPRDLVTVDLSGDLVPVDLDGPRREGHWRPRPRPRSRSRPRPRPRPSRELALHLAIYRARADVQAIVHAHGTHAQAWSFLGVPLAPPIEETTYYGIGPVRVSAPAPAGSAELGVGAARALGDSAAVLLGGHGLVAVGADLQQALLVARVVEHHAHVAWLLRNAGDAGKRAHAGDSGKHAARGHGPGTPRNQLQAPLPVSDILG
jgi:L-fuculose-phosphate aldolase